MQTEFGHDTILPAMIAIVRLHSGRVLVVTARRTAASGLKEC